MSRSEPEIIVLDADAAIALAKGVEEGRALRMLLEEGERIIAPHYFMEEVANVAWKYTHAQRLSESDAMSLFWDALSLVDAFAETEPLLTEAVHEAVRSDHPVYDMLYFVLARRNAATLFTFDKKLRAICQANGVNCLGIERF